jgi:DNA polymerase-1
VERKAYRESLEQNEAQILQSRELVTIHTGLPLDLNLSELALAAPDVEASRQLFTELEFTSLLDEFLPTAEVVGEAYAAVQNLQELGSLAARLKGRQAALALELASDEYLESPVLGVAVSDRPGQAWYLPEDLLRRHPDATIQALASPAGWAIHDLKPLCFVAQRHGWPTPVRAFDTALAAYLLFPNQADYSLRKLAIEQLGVSAEGGEDTDAELGRTEQACRRADLTLRLWPVLETQLGARRLDELLWKVEIPLVEVLAAMEEAGVRVDCDVLRAMSEEMETEIQRLTSDIYRLAGEEFNINSPRQLADVLFEKLRLPQSKKTRKAGHFATGVEVLEQLAQSHELPRKVLEYRELSKLKGTYLDALPRLVNPRTERIHTRFNQMVASTGRLSSSNPNLQNIPMKSDLGRKMRRAFVAGPGCRILAADYSQIELRVMAHLSQDQSLVEAFNRQEDIHERTAREVFGMHAAMNPQEFRRLAKVINFGIIYGLSAFGLARTLKIERLEAQRYIDDYFRRYSGVKKWIDWTIEQARSTGCVTTLFGRIRQIPEIASSNWTLRSFGERTAVNAPIQGTAADLIKIAMVSLFREMRRRGLRSKMIMQVHDELVFEVEESELDVMRPLVRQQMEGAAQLSVPLKVGLAEGPTWLEAK